METYIIVEIYIICLGMPCQKWNDDWNIYTERQRTLATSIAESLLSYFYCVETNKIHASAPRAELTDPSPWRWSTRAESRLGREDPGSEIFPGRMEMAHQQDVPPGILGRIVQDFFICGFPGTHKSRTRGPGVSTQHAICTPLLFWQTPLSKGKMANELHRYFIILWGVLGCPRT